MFFKNYTRNRLKILNFKLKFTYYTFVFYKFDYNIHLLSGVIFKKNLGGAQNCYRFTKKLV
jgi:hypothetical protein